METEYYCFTKGLDSLGGGDRKAGWSVLNGPLVFPAANTGPAFMREQEGLGSFITHGAGRTGIGRLSGVSFVYWRALFTGPT